MFISSRAREKKKTKTYEVSVRGLVEFVLRSGDIISGFSSSTRNLEGTRLHQKLQKAEKEGYEKEHPFQKTIPLSEDVALTVQGRADGLYRQADGSWVVDEIKSTVVSLENLYEDMYPLHWAQAKCYAYMLQQQEEAQQVVVRLSYVHVDTEAVRYFYHTYTREELSAFWVDLVQCYRPWVLFQHSWKKQRADSLAALSFPFAQFRPGQRTMAAYVYHAIAQEEKVFLQAPTGIGKTLSALFPALKSMAGESGPEKIFYVTAKNITAKSALQAALLLRKQPLRLKSLQLIARDKICLLVQEGKERRCDPQVCPYARGHFDRVNEAMWQGLTEQDHFEKEQLLALAEKHSVCPFELALDLANFMDLILCDYNYAFDPTASLKRFFQDRKQNFVLLIDEAHNLVDRARAMYSADLNKQAFLDLRKTLPKKSALFRCCSKINDLFLALRREMGDTRELFPAAPDAKWQYALQRFCDKMEEHLQLQSRTGEIAKEAWELYFRVLFFMKIGEQKGPGYETFARRQGHDLVLRYFCVNPAEPLKAVYQKVRSAIFFSATLMPVQYYKELLGADEKEGAIALPSPFDPRRRQVMTCRINATFQGRQESLSEVCQVLRAMTAARSGHYLAFFPSFAYLTLAQQRYQELYPEEPVLVQTADMSEEERADFLRRLTEDPAPVLGFAVLGGVFSEGIDLKGDSLIGAAIVSVGLPQLSPERDLMKRHMAKEEGAGFEYAYMYPGLCKVLQAAGRVIRTESDAGVILLLDERFSQQRYYQLYPPEWHPVITVRPDAVPQALQTFWNQIDEEAKALEAKAPQKGETDAILFD